MSGRAAIGTDAPVAPVGAARKAQAPLSVHRREHPFARGGAEETETTTSVHRRETPSVRDSKTPSLRGGAEEMAADRSTFAPALRLLPDPLKADVGRLYRVLRTLDDLVDEHDPQAAERVRAVECWARGEQTNGSPARARSEQTNGSQVRARGGQGETPETRALQELSRRYPLPREALLDFCAGMRHDIARASIEDEEDFARYCQQAGGAVGIVLASMLGTAHPEGESKMAALGRAMQVTNILRDIDEDLAHGRVYIAQSAIRRFGFPAPGSREALLRDHIAHADALYEEGAGAIALLLGGRRAMALSATLYREILRQLERDGFGRRPGRAAIPAWRMRMLIAKHRLGMPGGRSTCAIDPRQTAAPVR